MLWIQQEGVLKFVQVLRKCMLRTQLALVYYNALEA